jgi:hypothetical protein
MKKKLVILMTPIAHRWLNNHCETVSYNPSEEGLESIVRPKVIEQITTELKGQESVTINLNRYILKNKIDGSENTVRQFIQSSYRLGNKIVVRLGLKYESNGKKVICSIHGYKPDYKNVEQEQAVANG